MALRANSKVKFDASWWRKESPKELFRVKEFTRFIDAMDDFGSAEQKLDIQSADDQLSAEAIAELKKAKAALAAIEKPRKEFLDYAQDRASDIKAKKEREPYDILVKVLKDGVPAALRDAHEMLDSLDGDPVGAPMVTPDAHGAYLKRSMPRMKRLPLNFGFALVSNEPTDQRFNLHSKKGARSLAGSLRNDVKPRVLTWGRAMGGGIHPSGQYTAATLVLEVQGKMVPSFARRVRVMLKAFKITLFNNVVVLKDGQAVDKADKDDTKPFEEVKPDNLEAIDFDAPDPEPAPEPVKSAVSAEALAEMTRQDEIAAAAPPPAPPPDMSPEERAKFLAERPKSTLTKEDVLRAKQGTPEKQRWMELRKELAPRVEYAISTQFGAHKKIKQIWILALKAEKAEKFGDAIKTATMIKKLIADLKFEPIGPKLKYEKNRPKVRADLMKCFKEGIGDPEAMACAFGMADLCADDGNYEEALRYWDIMAKYRDQPPQNEIPKDPIERLDLAKDLVAKLDAMRGDLPDALEALKDAKAKDKQARVVKDNIRAAEQALGGGTEADCDKVASDPNRKFDFNAALMALGRLDEVFDRAKRDGYKQGKLLNDIKKTVAEYDEKLSAVGHLVTDPALKPYFKKISKYRKRLTKFLWKDDLYGAKVAVKPWQAKVESLLEQVSETA